MPGFESTMVYWTDVLYERPDPDLAAFEKGAGFGVAKSPEGHHGIRFRKSDSHQTRPWREPDSNYRFRGSDRDQGSRWNCNLKRRPGPEICCMVASHRPSLDTPKSRPSLMKLQRRIPLGAALF